MHDQIDQSCNLLQSHCKQYINRTAIHLNHQLPFLSVRSKPCINFAPPATPEAKVQRVLSQQTVYLPVNLRKQ